MKASDMEFLSNSLSFDQTWLENEFSSPELITYKSILELYISNLIGCLGGNNPKEDILSCFNLKVESIKDERLYEVFDSMRHAFTSYASGGLYDLYIYQSNESWYPKIVLKSELKPNDILDLPSKLVIYRGCNGIELATGKYGQSWSTNFEVAEEFAYQHYNSQSWYKKENRCILKASVSRCDVFFSRQNHHEKEVSVNTEKLINVQKT